MNNQVIPSPQKTLLEEFRAQSWPELISWGCALGCSVAAAPYIGFALEDGLGGLAIPSAIFSAICNAGDFVRITQPVFESLLNFIFYNLASYLKNPFLLLRALPPVAVREVLATYSALQTAKLVEGYAKALPKLDTEAMRLYVQFAAFFMYKNSVSAAWRKILWAFDDHVIGLVRGLYGSEKYFKELLRKERQAKERARLERNQLDAFYHPATNFHFSLHQLSESSQGVWVSSIMKPALALVAIFFFTMGGLAGFRNTCEDDLNSGVTSAVVITTLGVLFSGVTAEGFVSFLGSVKYLPHTWGREWPRIVASILMLSAAYLTTPLALAMVKRNFDGSSWFNFIKISTIIDIVLVNSQSMTMFVFWLMKRRILWNPEHPDYARMVWDKKMQAELHALPDRGPIPYWLHYPHETLVNNEPLFDEPELESSDDFIFNARFDKKRVWKICLYNTVLFLTSAGSLLAGHLLLKEKKPVEGGLERYALAAGVGAAWPLMLPAAKWCKDWWNGFPQPLLGVKKSEFTYTNRHQFFKSVAGSSVSAGLGLLVELFLLWACVNVLLQTKEASKIVAVVLGGCVASGGVFVANKRKW